jgi:hypothetical protein
LSSRSVDERHEKVPVQPVLVEVARRPVRRGDDHDTGVEKLLEQPPDDHRIGDIGDLHLVEGTAGAGPRDLLRHRFDRIVHAGLARLVQGRLHLLHEGVEMHPPLGLDAGMGEEKVHQHGLAPPDAAPEIKPLLARGFGPRNRDRSPLRSGASSFSRSSSSRSSAARCTGSGRSMPSATRVS